MQKPSLLSPLPPLHIISKTRKPKLLSGTVFCDVISTGLLAPSYLPPSNHSKGGVKTEYIVIIIPPSPSPLCPVH